MYLVVELQKKDGQMAALNYSYQELSDAESKFFAIMSAAAISSIPKHGAILVSEDGHLLRGEVYRHTPQNNQV